MQCLTSWRARVFTRDKHAAQESPFQHLLKPKVGGVGFVIEALEDKLHHLVDVTLHYPNGAPGFYEFLSGDCPEVHLTVTLHEIPSVADGEFRDAVSRKVEALWQDKDSYLQALRGVPHDDEDAASAGAPNVRSSNSDARS